MDLARILELLAGFDQAIAHLEFDRSVKGALEFLQANLAVARASIGLQQNGGEGFVLFDTARPIVGLASGVLYPQDTASLDQTVRSSASIYRPDIRTWPHPNLVDHALIEVGLLSTFTVPLVVGGRCIGALAVAGAGVDSLDPTERDVLERIAPRLAHVVKSSLTVHALSESEAGFRAVFDSVSDGLLVADLRTRRLLLANPSVARLLGRNPAELLSLRVEDLFAPEMTSAIVDSFESTLQGNRAEFARNTDVPMIKKDGTPRLVDIGTSFMMYRGRECLVGMFRDADERKRREAELVQAEKLESIRTLAAGIAHDFNNLLTGIVGNISLARLKVPGDHPVRTWLDEAQRATSRATELTRQLLTFTKGGKPIRRETDLTGVIQDAASDVVRGSGSRCEFDLSPSTWPAMADAHQIAQVIRNLVLNAIQAMPRGGVVHLSSRNVPPDDQHPDPRVCVTVRDQGSGIPSDHLDKVFVPFFSTKEKGTGMGLSVAYSIISNHDGQIEVESQEGKGTAVRFWLPAVPENHSQQHDEQPTASVGSRRILIMDDEEMVGRVSEALLQHAGYETLCVPDGRQAIEAYVEQRNAGRPFDVVILDLTVPGGMGGKEAAAGILAVDPGARILVSSGYSNDEVMANPRQFGFAGVISKPFDADQLCGEVQRVLRRASTP